MDLCQRAFLRRASVNCLRGALRERQDPHLLWSSGTDVRCSQLRFIEEREAWTIDDEPSTVLWRENSGDSRVIQAFWSAKAAGYPPEDQLVAVLREDGVMVAEIGRGPKLVPCKEIPGQFQPHGCAWHPTKLILAVLTKQEASVLSFTKDTEDLILPNAKRGRLVSCVWSSDGCQLAVCSSNHLVVYSWEDLDDLKDFHHSGWASLENDYGVIHTAVAMGPSTFLLATEPPINKLLGTGTADVFDVNIGTNYHEERDTGPNYEELLVARSCMSDHSLLKFKWKEESSQLFTRAHLLVLDSKGREIVKLCSTAVQDLLSPDLLLHEPNSNAVIVGSNSWDKIHIFNYSPATAASPAGFHRVREIRLQPKYLPKGLSAVPSIPGALLVLLACPKKDSLDAFPPVGCFDECHLKLQCLNIEMPSGRQEEQLGAVANSELSEVDACVPGELQSLRLPDGTLWQGMAGRKSCLISEMDGLENPLDKVDKKESGQAIQFQSQVKKIEEQLASFQAEVTRQLHVLEAKFDALVEECRESRQNCLACKDASLDKAEYVHIEWSTRDGHTCRTFLLANGRLKLETVQKTFGTTLVQIRKDGHACIVSATEDGFIPIQFASGSTIHMSEVVTRH